MLNGVYQRLVEAPLIGPKIWLAWGLDVGTSSGLLSPDTGQSGIANVIVEIIEMFLQERSNKEPVQNVMYAERSQGQIHALKIWLGSILEDWRRWT